MTAPRLVFGAALALFPLLIAVLVQSQGGHLEREGAAAVALFALVPQIVTILALLLWVTPIVHAEMEGQTWIYLAVRPAGKGSIVVGKYLAAVFWTVLVALAALTAAMLYIRPETDALHDWGVLAGLTLLACLAYGSLYALVGVIFLRRAMVAAVGYTFLSEFILTWLPANVHQLTVQYHLRALGLKAKGWDSLPPGMQFDERLLFSAAPAWQHVAALAAFAVVLLALAVFVLRQRELVRGDQVA
jgi:ABC-type transport system involved in multi-copper enzyme maturation permease subunit